MAAINQEKFSLTTDDTEEELCNDAKNIKTSKSQLDIKVKCVEDLKQRKKHNFGNEGTRTDQSEQIT